MDTKFVIFVLISTFLVAAIYSSSVHIVDAKGKYCTTIHNAQFTCYDESGGDAIVTVCTISVIGKMTCHDYVTGKIATKLPPGAKDALDAASKETQNTTKVPNTDFLKDNNILQNNNTSNDNIQQPKAPAVP